MNKKVKILLGLLVLIVAIGGAVLAYDWLSAPGHEPVNLMQELQNPEPVPAADFAFLDQAGNNLRLSDFFGTPIILNFWASWCPACVMESPYFETLYQETRGEIHILKVNLLDGARETRTIVDSFMDEFGYTFPLFFDTTGESVAAYGIRGIPQTLFINPEGYIVARMQGAVSEQSLRDGLAAAHGSPGN